MTAIEIKTSLHKLIDSFDNEKQLAKVYQILETMSTVNENGDLWARLTPGEQDELLEIEKECHDTSNLIDHEEAMKRHKKWL
jgi:uncharacterized protein YerC